MNGPKYKVGDRVVFHFDEPHPKNYTISAVVEVLEGPNDGWIYKLRDGELVHEQWLEGLNSPTE